MLEGTDEEKHMTRSVLLYTLDKTMKMLHPFMPFVTEEIYQSIEVDRTIVNSEWPSVDETLIYPQATNDMALLVEIIKSIRQTRNEVNTPLSKEIDIKIEVKDDKKREAVSKNRHYLERFCNPKSLDIKSSIEAGDDDKTDVVSGATIVLPLSGLINKEAEIERLNASLEKLEGELKRVDGKLSNERFVSNAPEAVVQKEKEKKENYQVQYEEVKSRLEHLKGMD